MHYQNGPRFNGVYSRDNLPDKITVIYFDSFGVEHISKEIKKFINKKKHNSKYF